MSVRKFKLINALGNEWNLMNRDAYFSVPDGLGFSTANEYMKIGSSYQLVSTSTDQKVISGEMVFRTYALYAQFASFISFTPLKLAYKPMSEWAYLDCEVSNLGKSEISHEAHRLLCPIDFTATSKWYIPRLAQRSGIETPNAKKYTYTYNYEYAEAINGIININNTASEECPAIITILGDITNPTWSLIQNGKILQSGQVTANIPSGNKLVICSKDNALEIAEYTMQNEFVRNQYQNSDFSKENFIYVPVGNSTLLVSGNVQQTIDAYIEVEEIHETI